MARAPKNYDDVNFDLEAKLQKKVNEYLDSLAPDLSHRHISDRFKVGISDNIGCCKGKFFAIELKILGNELSQHQIKYAASIIASGGEFACCYTLGQVKNFVKKLI